MLLRDCSLNRLGKLIQAKPVTVVSFPTTGRFQGKISLVLNRKPRNRRLPFLCLWTQPCLDMIRLLCYLETAELRGGQTWLAQSLHLLFKRTHGLFFFGGPGGCLFLAARSTSAEGKIGDTTNGLPSPLAEHLHLKSHSGSSVSKWFCARQRREGVIISDIPAHTDNHSLSNINGPATILGTGDRAVRKSVRQKPLVCVAYSLKHMCTWRMHSIWIKYLAIKTKQMLTVFSFYKT